MSGTRFCPASAADPDLAVLFSMDALRRAWQSVRRNGSSPGVDRVSVPQFGHHLEAELRRLHDELLAGAYRPQKALRFYRLKASGQKRPLTLWTVRDRVVQRVVHDYLTPVLEPIFLPCSYGFRPGKRVEDATRAVQEALTANRRWIVDADIANCFDSVPPGPLLAKVQAVVRSPTIHRLIAMWLHTPLVGQPGQVTGISQGSVLSPQLTNLYLHRFDQTLLAALPEATLVRFADDFVILCRRKAEAERALTIAGRTLAGLQLRVNPEKTRVIHADEGFAFLGMPYERKVR